MKDTGQLCLCVATFAQKIQGNHLFYICSLHMNVFPVKSYVCTKNYNVKISDG